jgi:hypothetical protein
MCLHPELIPPVPEITAKVAKAAFPKGNKYMRLRDELGAFYQDKEFAQLYPNQGQSAIAPWRLVMILIMQFLENLFYLNGGHFLLVISIIQHFCYPPITDQTKDSPLLFDQKNINLVFVTARSEMGFLDSTTI